MKREEISEGKAKLAQQKLRENHLPQLTGNQIKEGLTGQRQHQLQVGGSGFILLLPLISFLLLSVDEHKELFTLGAAGPHQSIP